LLGGGGRKRATERKEKKERNEPGKIVHSALKKNITLLPVKGGKRKKIKMGGIEEGKKEDVRC